MRGRIEAACLSALIAAGEEIGDEALRSARFEKTHPPNGPTGIDARCGLEYLREIWKSGIFMTTRAMSNQIIFRYRTTDSATGITRETAKRLAEHLGVDETRAINIALHDLAVKVLIQYEADNAGLTAAQVRQIRNRAPQGSKRSVRSSLFDKDATKHACPRNQ